jgi:hypothetical protein
MGVLPSIQAAGWPVRPEIVESGLLVEVEFCRLVAVSRVLAHLAAE